MEYRKKLYFIFFIFIFCIISNAYSKYEGIEYDDVVDITLLCYLNGEIIVEYTSEGPIKVKVNAR